MQASGDTNRRIAVVGGGLVGALNACFLARRGYHVDVYESRSDIRKAQKVIGRSINLALSHRGRAALRAVGLEEHVTAEGIPMPARLIHDLDGSTHAVPYGTKPEHYIISIDRRRLNEVMLSLAEKNPRCKLHFSHKLADADLEAGKLTFKLPNGELAEKTADIIIGCDGAYSMVRQIMMKHTIFNYSQEYIEHGYIELETPPGPDGDYIMPPNFLHIWPRHTFMLIALPNLDRSFTTTLFMPFANFDELKTREQVLEFFKTTFPDALQNIGETRLVEGFLSTKPSSLVSIKCKPYHFGKAIIMGDAAHAMVPFYGQGMNAGFLDCLKFDEMISRFNGDFDLVLPTFTREMNPNSEAIIDLAMYNYIEMRHLVTTNEYKMRKKLDNLLHWLLPNTWVPLYTMVTFSLTPYRECMDRRAWQDKTINRVIKVLGITAIGGVLAYILPVRRHANYLRDAVPWDRFLTPSKWTMSTTN